MRTEEGLLLLNERGKILWSNDFAAELLGYSRAELETLSLPLVGSPSAPSETPVTQRIRIAPSLRESGPPKKTPVVAPVGPVAAAFRAILAGEVTETEGEARIPDKDERRIAVHWKLWSLPSGNNQSRQILLIVSETAQASAEGPITSSYRDIFEHAVEGIYRATLDGKFLEVNPALAQMCGYSSPSEMIASVQDLNTQIYLKPNRRAEFLREILQNDSVSGFESEAFRADGSVFWIAEFSRIVRGAQGEPLYLEGSVINVSKRKQAETALRLSEEKFRNLVETSRVVPFEFHFATSNFAYLGPQAEEIFRNSLGANLSWDRWVSLLHPDDRFAGTHFAKHNELKSEGDYQTEFRIVTPEDEVIWIKQIFHYDGRDEEVGGVLRGFFFDITEAKTLETDRENSRAQLRELAARLEKVREEERMSIGGEIHDEVGQALTLLKIDLAWMTERLGAPVTDKVRTALEARTVAMEQKITAAFQTVRGILLSLRPPLLEELGLKDAIEYHLAELAKRVGFRYEIQATSAAVLDHGAKTVLFRIFQEILTNVVRHARASRVKVRMFEFGEDFFIVVQDNGCGAAKETFRDPTKLGIMGIKERAAALGGEVEVESWIGKGTTVSVRIPLEQIDHVKGNPGRDGSDHVRIQSDQPVGPGLPRTRPPSSTPLPVEES